MSDFISPKGGFADEAIPVAGASGVRASRSGTPRRAKYSSGPGCLNGIDIEQELILFSRLRA